MAMGDESGGDGGPRPCPLALKTGFLGLRTAKLFTLSWALVGRLGSWGPLGPLGPSGLSWAIFKAILPYWKPSIKLFCFERSPPSSCAVGSVVLFCQCAVLSCYVMLCSVLSCSVLSCCVLSCSSCSVLSCCVLSCSSRARGGMRRDSQGHSGTIRTTWGLAAAVCRVNEAGFPGVLGDHRDNLGSGARGMQDG